MRPRMSHSNYHSGETIPDIKKMSNRDLGEPRSRLKNEMPRRGGQKPTTSACIRMLKTTSHPKRLFPKKDCGKAKKRQKRYHPNSPEVFCLLAQQNLGSMDKTCRKVSNTHRDTKVDCHLYQTQVPPTTLCAEHHCSENERINLGLYAKRK